MMKKWFLWSAMATLFTVGIISTAWADCVSGGVVYPEGSFVGGKVCIGGRWVSR